MKVCLNMIVKNESAVIVETLDNLLKYIPFAYWVISDTGSTDNTQQIIREYFQAKSIPGELVEHEWRDFGYNRTKALEAAYKKSDYLLIFDADDKIHGNFVLPNTKSGADRYMLKFGQGFEYVRPLLINNQKRWEFKGVLHEFLSNIDPVNADQTIAGDYYIESGRSGSRSQDPLKYYKDACILKNAYELEQKLPDKGLAGRYAFYCGRSFKDAGSAEAIEWYKKVLADPQHWNQERYYSALEIGTIYSEQGNMLEAVKYWLKTIECDHERIEGVVLAVEHLYHSGQHVLVNALYHKFQNYNRNLENKLFINKHFYRDRLEFFNAISAFYVGDKASGFKCCKQLLRNKLVGEQECKVIMNNLIFYREIIEREPDCELFYDVDDTLARYPDLIKNKHVSEIWQKLFAQNRPQLTATRLRLTTPTPTPTPILLTITTCKRLNLFKETVNSILNHWTDLDQITHWFCVDDNSSQEDRRDMKKSFSWFEYYMKTPAEKGHRRSMNIIWQKLQTLKPTYWIHLEDDFLFYHPMDYVTQSVAALKQLAAYGVKQIVFNRNYAETVDNYVCQGHLPSILPQIVLHDHKPTEAITHYQNAHYWPHYSFRPSMVDVETILSLGNYDSPNVFFERDYADRWQAANHKTAFFNRITHRHIGRLTTEINTATVKNAYQLNEETQFNTAKKINHIKIINLKRRPDRKAEMIEKCNWSQYDIFEAIDGNTLVPTAELKTLFDGNDFGSRAGVIACALSHLTLWRQLVAESATTTHYVIFEDDCNFVEGFQARYDALVPTFKTTEFLLLGYSMFAKKRQELKHIYEYTAATTTLNIEPLNKAHYVGGSFAYSINQQGAQKLLKYIAQHGIKHGIDYIFKLLPELEIQEVQPQLVLSEWNESGKLIDTDIQYNYKTLDFRIEEQFVFYPQLDQIGNDSFFQRAEVTTNMARALQDPQCVGFNTLGFFKNKITELTKSRYFGLKDGIYLKRGVHPPGPPIEGKVEEGGGGVGPPKENIRGVGGVGPPKENIRGGGGVYPPPLRVKLLCNWCSSEQLCQEWSNMCFEGYQWENIEITWTDEHIDYYVIINQPPPHAYYEPKRTIVFQMEPWVKDPNKPWGVKTWCEEWSTPDPQKFFKVFTHKTHLNNVQWQIDWPFQRKSIPLNKLDKVATICSYKNTDEGHLLRNAFIKTTQNIIEVWGRQNYHSAATYQGMVPDDNKYNVYAAYKYCFSAENNWEENYATEKIWEPILCESLCFYWGCPNLEEYINPQAFVRLPLEDPPAAIKIIQQALAEDWWSQRIGAIKQTKDRILNELGFFPRLQKQLQKNIALCFCVKNCELYLPKIFHNISRLKTNRNLNVIAIFVYDNCSDQSEQLLEEYQKQNSAKVIVRKIVNSSPYTTVRIAKARNTCLDIVYNELTDISFHIMIDSDNVCAHEWDLAVINKYLNNSAEEEEWDCMSFNRDDYYDIWALMFDDFKHDCWGFGKHSAQVSCIMRKGIVDKLNTNSTSASTCGTSSIEVISAFNGFAIYKTERFQGFHYDGLYEKVKDLILEKERLKTIEVLKPAVTDIQIHDKIECCEHIFFHLSAYLKGRKIKISKYKI